uniref:Obscurin-like protein 1 n=1 Tax=Anabas testudineus TaxID=64144 RepID=A0A3Q1JI89_ANATE
MDVFGGAPRFLAYPRPVMVQSGTDAVLKCQIGGDPRPAVIWERNNEKIDPQGRYRVFEDGNVYNLIISAVTTEDSGQYICKAKNSIGETYAAATLKVEGEAQEMELREENKPRFLIKPLSTRVGRGEDAVFSCKLWGNPRPEVVWEKDGRKLNEIFESTHFTVGYQDGGWFQLKIFKTRAPDGGVYTCKARNEFGEALAGAVLLVDAGPGHEEEGNLKMFAVTEGKHAKFRCFVTGKPKPEIIWRKDGRLILSGRRYLLYEDREGYFTLKVLYCKQKDNGVYVCAASNTAGQTLSAIHLSVKEPPVRFKQPLIDLEVWERDLAILECEVPEDSVPITWYLEDRRLQPGAKYGMEEWGTKRRLTIRDIGVDDDGIYLCEMPDGGRSIAEVAVRGTILRKLPRKVDVLEGENAAFCVEVEKEEMDIHWYKDGIELRETHQTILKSFGRTHILVFVNTMPQDSGLVTFLVGRSKTSSQLRVKAARHCPPSCPVGVQINTERANAALLSWIPAQDSRRNPPSGYVLERQEVGTGSQEWLQCLTTDSATSVEILGDSVPCEADYRFRICSVNKYGKSNNVEFPRAVHLVPVARIQAPLQDALVPEGQDALFSIELSASVIGTWFLNGTQIQEDERFSMRRSRTHQSLRIRGVRDTDNGAEITFIAYGIRDSAALYIQGMSPLVRFTAIPDDERNKTIQKGCPIVLHCELSDPSAQVHWYKDGSKLHPQNGVEILTEVHFHVDVKAPLLKFSAIADADHKKTVMAGCPIALQCELSDPTGQVNWYKDGTKLLPQSGVDIQSEGNLRSLVVPSAQQVHTGVYRCESKDDDIQFAVETDKNKNIQEGTPIVLSCELSHDPSTHVDWYKDGMKLLPQNNVEIQSEGLKRTLLIQSAERIHSGIYKCSTSDDALVFKVAVKGQSPKIMPMALSEKYKMIAIGCPITLQCEVSEPLAQVSWFKDEVELFCKTGLDMKRDGSVRKLMIHSAKVSDSGVYSCSLDDDVVTFNVDVEAPPVTFAEIQSQMELCQQTSERMVLSCEISQPNAAVRWYRDGLEVEENDNLILEVDGVYRRLIIPETTVKDSAEYVCDTADDSMTFFVNIAEPPVRFVRPRKMASRLEKVAGESLVLDCEVSRLNAEVIWKKNGEEVEDSRNVTILEDASSTDHWELRQPGAPYPGTPNVIQLNGLPSAPRVVEFIAELHNITVCEGEDAVFKCVVSPEDTRVVWHLNDKQVALNERAVISSNGLCHMLCLHNCMVSDSGRVTADAEGLVSEAELQVQGELVLFTKKITPVTAEEYSDAILEVEVSVDSGEVQWMRQGVLIHPDAKYTLKHKGRKHSLTIHKLAMSDRGTYSCETLHDRTQAQLTVERECARVLTIETASFEVELSHPNVPGTWIRNGIQLKPTNHFRMSAKGQVHSLTISNLSVEDTGTFMFCVDNLKTSARLVVKEPPVTIFRKLEDQRFPEGAVISIECELSRHNVDVKWLKNGVEMKPDKDLRIYAMGRKRFLQIMKCQVSDSGMYICDAGDRVGPLHKIFCSTSQRFSMGEDQNAVFVCEISVEDVPGEWYKNGERIQPNSTVKIRQEGTKHFLLMCNVRAEDSGEIKFVARHVESVAYLDVEGLPVSIVKPLQDKTVLEKTRVILDCTVSNPRCSIRWYKGINVVLPSEHFEICSEGCYRKLIMQQVELEDEGTYSVQVGEYSCSAKLTVEGKRGKELWFVHYQCTGSHT